MSHHPQASVLRQRAGHLRDLADTIERSLVMDLADRADGASWTGKRAELCIDMLDRNIQQLYQAADDLRVTAFRFRQRADDLDAAARSGSAA